jgi:pimeloyl-ACP methyl ester carboxylesterase
VTRLHFVETTAAGRHRGTIVALPGLAESAETLAVTARHWALRGFRVLSIDPRGHGRSPRWTPELLRRHPGDVIVDEVLETISPKLDGGPLVLFGHSAGGSAAAAVAAREPSGLVGVLLEDPFWRLPVTHHQDRHVAEAAAATLEHQQSLTDAERLAELAALHPLWPADELDAWSESKQRMDVALVRNGDVIPARGWPTLLEDLAGAGIRVHIVTGTVAIGITANHRAIARSLGAAVTVIEGAGHFVRRDARDRFHDIADAFLDETVPAP